MAWTADDTHGGVDARRQAQAQAMMTHTEQWIQRKKLVKKLLTDFNLWCILSIEIKKWGKHHD